MLFCSWKNCIIGSNHSHFYRVPGGMTNSGEVRIHLLVSGDSHLHPLLIREWTEKHSKTFHFAKQSQPNLRRKLVRGTNFSVSVTFARCCWNSCLGSQAELISFLSWLMFSFFSRKVNLFLLYKRLKFVIVLRQNIISIHIFCINIRHNGPTKLCEK